ncbi:MAG: ATP-dependent helicase [Clostridium sp.]|nr:ATP-dependent helicase [Clostridium sp.]
MSNDLLESLNKQQRAAVTFNGRHLLVLAGAGTGKTRTIIARARWLIEQQVDPRRILILSFTRKSAAEIVGRIKENFTSGQVDGLTGTTFHSWCLSLIKNNPEIFPQADFTLLDEDDRTSCLRLICGKNFKDSHGRRIKADEVAEVYSFAVNARCSLSEAIRMKLYNNAPADTDVEAENKLLSGVIKMYLAYKQERRYMDYDDLLITVANGLKRNEAARAFVASRYDHILIDEMQDTNPLQYRLLESFQQGCRLFCVGDDAQSIYGFRGADFKTIHSFRRIVPDSETFKLTVNYRSTQEILDLSNWLLDQSPLIYDKRLTAARGAGEKPLLLHVDNEWEQADDITNRIAQSRTHESRNYADNMVLARSRRSLGAVESSCLKKKIPYVIYGGLSLLQSAHIRDVVAPIRIVANYRDELAWMRYLVLWQNIGEVKAARIVGGVIDQPSLDDAVYALTEMNLQSEIADTLNHLRDLQSKPARAVATAVRFMSKRLEENYKAEWEWRKKDFVILEDVAAGSSSIAEFVSDYILDPRLEITNKEGADVHDCVVLSTIHSSKGLEAPLCYLVDVSAGVYPTTRAIKEGEDTVEEERRCLYVALTRARDRLILYRNMRSLHAVSADTSDTAYFLNDLPTGLYRFEILTGANGGRGARYNGPKVDPDIANDFNFD